MRRTLLALLLLSQCTPALVRADDEPKQEGSDKKLWLVDFEKAKKIAAEKGLDVMMEFTGSDWCPPCKALKAGVFDKEVFQTTAPKHFVLVKLDNPRDKSKQSKEEQEQYRKLSQVYSVSGVPTVILADPEGKPYAKIVGYGRQKAEVYTDNLVEQIANRKTRDEAFAKAKKAEGVERAKLLDETLEALPKKLGASLIASTYGDEVAEIIKLDTNDQAGLKTKYEGKLKLVKQEALFFEAVQQFRTDKDAAKKTLEEAMKIAPDSEKGKEIKQILERAFKEDDKEEKKPNA